jgi:osmoprotectant transport system ATP-binding protein
VPLGSSLYDALALLLGTGADCARVTGEGGEPVGLLSRQRVLGP